MLRSSVHPSFGFVMAHMAERKRPLACNAAKSSKKGLRKRMKKMYVSHAQKYVVFFIGGNKTA